MDLGTGIAVASVSFALVGVFYRIVPPRTDCSTKHCQDHSGVIKSIESIDAWLCKIDDKVDKLLRNGKGQ